MKRLATIVLACALAATGFCSTQVYRLNLDTETGETTLVGMDDVTRRVHLLTDMEYEWVTNICQKWVAYMNADKQRRAIYHGEVVGKTVVTNETGVMTMRTEYEDGFIHVEMARVRRPLPTASSLPKQLQEAKPSVRPHWMSERQFRMRERRKKALKKEPIEITIEHDANTGKDTVR